MRTGGLLSGVVRRADGTEILLEVLDDGFVTPHPSVESLTDSTGRETPHHGQGRPSPSKP